MYYTTSNNKLIRNKTSIFVEQKVEEILSKGIKPSDLTLIIAWKTGNIDHKLSNNKLVYTNKCNESLEFKGQYNTIEVKSLIEYININFKLLVELARMNPYELYNRLFENKVKYFGATYIITLLYFFTGGILPIYDKYAHIALLAIDSNIKPFQKVENYNQIASSNQRKAWEQYMNYCKIIIKYVGDDNYINRNIDRSLWVYGHAFIKD